MHAPSAIRGLLIDLDGVCHINGTPIPGAAAALRRIADAGLPCRFLTNTTTRNRGDLARSLQAGGLPIAEAAVFNAPRAAARYLREHGNLAARLVVADAVREDFAGCLCNDQVPQAVVIGDIGRGWGYDLLDGLFRQILAGAQLVALHKGRYWQTADGLSLDIGAFVSGLEYATGREAVVIGKPSPAFFLTALSDLGLAADAVAVVGDDIESDIGGGQACGLTGVLVHTGKWRAELAAQSKIRPHHQLPSLAELPDWLGL